MFFQARDIYEEAIFTVTTVRDFTQVFDAYAQFEELSLSKKMEEVSEKPAPTEDGKCPFHTTTLLSCLYD